MLASVDARQLGTERLIEAPACEPARVDAGQVRTSPLAMTRWCTTFMVVSTSTDFGEPEPARL